MCDPDDPDPDDPDPDFDGDDGDNETFDIIANGRGHAAYPSVSQLIHRAKGFVLYSHAVRTHFHSVRLGDANPFGVGRSLQQLATGFIKGPRYIDDIVNVARPKSLMRLSQ